MYSKILKKAFDPYFDAPLYIWETFIEKCEEVHFAKNEVIKKTGCIENNNYFILNGAYGIFLWNKNNYVCLDIVFENMFFAEYISLITKKPTPLETIAIEETKALRISRNNIDELKQTQWGNILFLAGIEYYFVEKQKQQINLLTKTAEERYKDLLEKHPEILQRVAQKYIASYLGITEQSLSRIKSKVRF